jgi:hypothetical protein
MITKKGKERKKNKRNKTFWITIVIYNEMGVGE